MTTPRERPWLSPGRPPWVPPWWHGLGRRIAVVGLLVLLDPARAARAWAGPFREFQEDR